MRNNEKLKKLLADKPCSEELPALLAQVKEMQKKARAKHAASSPTRIRKIVSYVLNRTRKGLISMQQEWQDNPAIFEEYLMKLDAWDDEKYKISLILPQLGYVFGNVKFVPRGERLDYGTNIDRYGFQDE